MKHQCPRTAAGLPRTKPVMALIISLGLVLASCADGADTTVEESAEEAVDQGSLDSDEIESGDQEGSEETDVSGTADESDAADGDAAADSDAADDTQGSDAATSDQASQSPSALPSEYLGSYTLADSNFGTMVTVTVDGTTRSIDTNALPDHETGEFPTAGNPNTISAQDLTWELPIDPVYTGSAGRVRTSGIAVNGVKFEPATNETTTCSDGSNYRIEALQGIYDLGLDFNNAHVQPTGEYHYHGISELLVGAYETDDDLVHIGFALDGHLMYYSKSGAYESGYELSDQARTGSDCEASFPGGETVDLEGTMPDGTYSSDWVFDTANGDLDSCNGVTIDGQYVYIITDTYPYISRCLNGEFAESGPGGEGPGEGGGAGNDEGAAPSQDQAGRPGGAPDMSEAAAALGISERELLDALGTPPPDLEAAAGILGVSVTELEAVLPAPPGR